MPWAWSCMCERPRETGRRHLNRLLNHLTLRFCEAPTRNLTGPIASRRATCRRRRPSCSRPENGKPTGRSQDEALGRPRWRGLPSGRPRSRSAVATREVQNLKDTLPAHADPSGRDSLHGSVACQVFQPGSGPFLGLPLPAFHRSLISPPFRPGGSSPCLNQTIRSKSGSETLRKRPKRNKRNSANSSPPVHPRLRRRQSRNPSGPT
jgi:hypothetical protein